MERGCQAGLSPQRLYQDLVIEKDIEDVMEMTDRIGVECMGLKWKDCNPWYNFGNLQYPATLFESARLKSGNTNDGLMATAISNSCRASPGPFCLRCHA
jgi:hypothetical protein